MLKQTCSLLISTTIVAFSTLPAKSASLVGSELSLSIETQRTSTSQLLVASSPLSAVVSESAVEFPNIRSLFNPQDFPGFGVVNASIDAGADYLEIRYPTNVGIGAFANTFKNDYVFTFAAPVALAITGITIDPNSTLRLTPERVTFSGNKLTVNVGGLLFNNNYFARLNLSTVTIPDLDGGIFPEPDTTAAVPEPTTLLGIALAGSGLAYLKRRRSA